MTNKLCPRYEVKLVRNGSVKYQIDGATPRIKCTAEAMSIVKDIVRSSMEDTARERFAIVTLDTKNKPIGFMVISEGTLDASLVHPREVFQPAVLQCAASVILVHNHPSGDLTPSSEDKAVTSRLETAGEVLGITVLDHIIVGTDADSGEWRSLSLKEVASHE
jgi:DNA repair protein RadC